MMNIKAEKFNNFLKENNYEYFKMEEVEGELHPVVYRSFLKVEGQYLPVMQVIDDSIYVMLQVRVGAGLIKEKNKAAVMNYLNSYNENYKVFKYYANENGDIFVESCIPTTDDEFVPALVQAITNVISEHLTNEYSKLMKIVWAE